MHFFHAHGLTLRLSLAWVWFSGDVLLMDSHGKSPFSTTIWDDIFCFAS